MIATWSVHDQSRDQCMIMPAEQHDSSQLSSMIIACWLRGSCLLSSLSIASWGPCSVRTCRGPAPTDPGYSKERWPRLWVDWFTFYYATGVLYCFFFFFLAFLLSWFGDFHYSFFQVTYLFFWITYSAVHSSAVPVSANEFSIFSWFLFTVSSSFFITLYFCQ